MNDKTKFFLSLGSIALIIMSPFLSFLAHNYADPAFGRWNFVTFSAITVLAVFCATVVGARAISVLFQVPMYRILVAAALPWSLLFFFSPIHSFAVSALDALRLPTGAMMIFVIVLMASALLMYLLAKREVILVGLSIFAAVSCAWASAQVAISAAQELHVVSGDTHSADSTPTVQTGGPNIYWIIVDSYTSPTVLKRVLDVDSSLFLAEMDNLGFDHVKDARAPYSMTFLTLAAILSQKYVVDETSRFGPARQGFYPAMLWARAPPSTVVSAKKMGYEFYLIGNSWGRCAGRHVKCLRPHNGMSYGVRTFLDSTPVRWLLFKYAPLVSSDTIGELLSALETKEIVKPYFLFAHHMPPHAPHVFNAKCEVRPSQRQSLIPQSDESPELYKESVECVNKKLQEFGRFIAKHDPQAIVVIQGDHGTSFTVDWDLPLADWTDSQIEERLSVLSLVRLPQDCKNWLTPDINSVNLVKLVFSCVQKTEPKFVPNRSYIGTYSGSDFGHVKLFYDSEVR